MLRIYKRILPAEGKRKQITEFAVNEVLLDKNSVQSLAESSCDKYCEGSKSVDGIVDKVIKLCLENEYSDLNHITYKLSCGADFIIPRNEQGGFDEKLSEEEIKLFQDTLIAKYKRKG